MIRFALKLAFVLVLALCASAYVWYGQTQGRDISKSVAPVKASDQEPAKARPVYPHSVVPGGVESRDELKKAMQNDRVVASHYQGIDPDKVRASKLTRDTTAYVSYRVKDKTYWTKRKVVLRKGEILLWDGTNWIRGRCGNRLAFVAQRPFLPPADEPRDLDFDEPFPDIPAELADLKFPDLTGPLPQYRVAEEAFCRPERPPMRPLMTLARLPLALTTFPARPLSSGSGLGPEPITEVPEPSTLFAVGAALALFAGCAVRRVGKKERR